MTSLSVSHLPDAAMLAASSIRTASSGSSTAQIPTGITDYLKSDGSLAEARKMANHQHSLRIVARLESHAYADRCEYSAILSRRPATPPSV